MALGKSISFIRNFTGDPEFREKCNRLSKEELLLRSDFTEQEFDDAINMQLVKCQTYDEADRIQQVRLWFMFL